MPRGSRGQKRGKLQWAKKSANRGRKPGQGKRAKFSSWKEVRAKIRRTSTVVVIPPAEEREALKQARIDAAGPSA